MIEEGEVAIQNSNYEVIMKYTMCRCERTMNYEEWNCYISTDDSIRINKILVFFRNDDNKIILLASQKEDLNDTNYLNDVIQLVHDLPIDFEFISDYVCTEDFENKVKIFKKKYNTF